MELAPVRDYELDSVSLRETRKVTVFLPPGYEPGLGYPALFCADGQAVHGFSARLSGAIDEGTVPPVILIGVHSHPELRAKEYLDGKDPGRFEAHAEFFAEEIYRWAIAGWSIATARPSCGVFGFSNGGAFALSMGVRHRERFGVVIAFSIAGGAERVAESEYARRPLPRYYVSAGTREQPFRRTGRALAKLLVTHGVEHVYTERSAGHDFGFWACELVEAIRWAFPQRKPT
jgi:enterochelin esterase-like enzyme